MASHPNQEGKTLVDELSNLLAKLMIAENEFIKCLTERIEKQILDVSKWKKVEGNHLKFYYPLSDKDADFLHKNYIEQEFVISMKNLSKKYNISLISPAITGRDSVWFSTTGDDKNYRSETLDSLCIFGFESNL